MTHLFSPLKIRDLTLRNRIGVSPMCQYSAEDGFATDWHLVHLGSRATGGAGMVIMEATAISPEGRISPGCTGIWKDAHIAPLKRITKFIREQGAAAGIQLAHAGRKGSSQKPWEGGKPLTKEQGAWETLAPSPIPFTPEHPVPKEMSAADIKKIEKKFVDAAKRAVKAGFQIIELHSAHGYLLHEFFSPLSNKRADSYGGSRDNRMRLILGIAEKIKKAVPEEIALGARLSCVDWTEDGLKIEDSVWLSAELKKRGVDFIDCSSGFVTADAKVPFAPGFQVPFAKEIREKTGILAAAVGMITEAAQADKIIKNGEADIVLLAREMLRDPYWPVHAAKKLNQDAPVPFPYLRGY